MQKGSFTATFHHPYEPKPSKVKFEAFGKENWVVWGDYMAQFSVDNWTDNVVECHDYFAGFRVNLTLNLDYLESIDLNLTEQ